MTIRTRSTGLGPTVPNFHAPNLSGEESKTMAIKSLESVSV